MDNIFTNKLGIARSFFALALLATLLINPKEVLFLESMTFRPNPTIIEQVNLFHLFGYENLNVSYAIAIIILVIAAVGIYPRFTGIFHWWVTISFFTSSIIVEGGDQVAQIFTLLFIPLTLMDSRKNHFNNLEKINVSKKNISEGIWLIMKIQAALIYLEAGIGKVYSSSIEWSNGTALYYWLNNTMFGREDHLLTIMNNLMSSPYSTYIFSYSVIVLEIILFGSLFSSNKKFKNILFCIAVCFHFSIIVFFGLISFFMNMTGLLIIFLLDLKQPLVLPKANQIADQIKSLLSFNTTFFQPSKNYL